MDNMKLHFDLPQEDELATSMLLGGLCSPYMSLYFMRDELSYRQYQCFYSQDPEQQNGDLASDTRKWMQSFLYLIQKLKARDIVCQMKNASKADKIGGFIQSILWRRQEVILPKPKRLLLKSPCHTGRVRLLLKLFPDARFVYVHRHPLDVFLSSAHMASTTYGYMFLQRPTDAQIQEYILKQGEILWGEYEACFNEGLLNEKVSFIKSDFLIFFIMQHSKAV